MRKVVASEFVSLDGVMEDPSWTFQFSSEEQEKFKFDELAASDALLLGRTTYEGFAAAWLTSGTFPSYMTPASMTTQRQGKVA